MRRYSGRSALLDRVRSAGAALFGRGAGGGDRRAVLTPGGHPMDEVTRALLGVYAETESGESIDAGRAMQVAAVWACVHILSRSIAKLPWPVYRRLDGSATTLAPDRPQYQLLHARPNPEMGAFDWRETMMGYALLYRYAIAEIERTESGKPVALWPIHPDRTMAERNPRTGRVQYRVFSAAAMLEAGGDPMRAMRSGAASVTLDMADVFVVRGMSFDGATAIGVIAQARESLGFALAAERCGARVFGNGAMPGLLLTHPAQLGDEAHRRLRESWEKNTTRRNQHRVRILEEGLQTTVLDVSLRNQQALELRQFQVVEVCRWFGVPPHKVFDLLRATFSNIEHQSLEFGDDSVRPWAAKFDQEAHYKLFTPAERRRYFPELRTDELRLVPEETRARVDSALVNSGIMRVNESRARWRLNALPPEIGDVLRVPVNTTTTAVAAGIDGGGETDPTPPGVDAVGVDET